METTIINTICGRIQMDTYEADATYFTSTGEAIIFARDSSTDGPYFEPINGSGRDWDDLHNAIQVIADSNLYDFADNVEINKADSSILLDRASDHEVDKWEAWVTNDPVALYDQTKAELLEHVVERCNDYTGEGSEEIYGNYAKVREVAAAALELIMDRDHEDVNDAIEAALEA